MARFEIIRKKETESTNSDLKELAKNGAKIGTVVISQYQSGGRGRMGRSFSSERGGLYMSILLPLGNPENAGLLTTYAAVATARALERLVPIEVKIKWVNDLFAGEKKICGILAEGIVRENRSLAVLGIGVNLTGELPKELSEIAATVLEVSGHALDPEVLANEILAEFEDFEAFSSGAHIEEYRHRCFVLGKNITVIPHLGENYAAKAVDITHNGRLLIEKDNGGSDELFSGEVSVRLNDK